MSWVRLTSCVQWTYPWLLKKIGFSRLNPKKSNKSWSELRLNPTACNKYRMEPTQSNIFEIIIRVKRAESDFCHYQWQNVELELLKLRHSTFPNFFLLWLGSIRKNEGKGCFWGGKGCCLKEIRIDSGGLRVARCGCGASPSACHAPRSTTCVKWTYRVGTHALFYLVWE